MGTDQDESGYRRQFNAAVSVIQSLPKSGSYRPSYEEMLLFYSYYKQATVGPCNIGRPGFWDPIGRYKWDAWNKLGQMSQEDAMCAYIREMKKVAQKIIDTVPLEDTSPELFEPFRPLYEVIPDMPRPPDYFFKTITEGETFEDDKYQASKEEEEEQYGSKPEQTELGAHRGLGKEEKRREPVGEAAQSEASDRRLGSWGSENEDFSDSLDKLEPDQNSKDDGSVIHPHLFQASGATHKKLKPKARRHSAERWKDHDSEEPSSSNACLRNPGESESSDMSSEPQNKCRSSSHNLSPQIAATVEALQASVQGLCQRLESLERALQDQQQYIRERTHRSPKHPKPQQSGITQSQTVLFIVMWPFFVHWLLRRLYGRKS
ncbi:acyl-CoA-binding domain-containing protein 4 isoform X1 [Rana temporaria]|uniref:acyl-CoA-binding domain-containing protein 4 isoform X1 n=1 Tax=Rana temporaria TaxID=8407 RepID=UPI001AAD6994|nr:acyl-CoA-binding domain-containing protein 4 isoform X1 [Rana temporaria]XP_040187752.1 acyl-CoA-binding domain-containing protein 4 isoform X1 [Rana temporaria]XP_040187753.1 acyl-CoA-binding domain-containing protein 4 isoform X1 [Rana temporaria]